MFGFHVLALLCLFISTSEAIDPPVQITEDKATMNITNTYLTIVMEKSTGLFSVFDETENTNQPFVSRGYFSQVGQSSVGSIADFGNNRSVLVTIDPNTNSGDMGEVTCYFYYIYNTVALPCNAATHVALKRGESSIYVYSSWEHLPRFPAFSVGEARFALRIRTTPVTDVDGFPIDFNELIVDKNRQIKPMITAADWDAGFPLNLKEARYMVTGRFSQERVEHKYDYAAVLSDTPAYGWVSHGLRQRDATNTTFDKGVWLIPINTEYIAGGPTKVELTGHRDVDPGGAPYLLNMFHGSHYGGSVLEVSETELWKKVFGPFVIFVNRVVNPSDSDMLWRDALGEAQSIGLDWPFTWVTDTGYVKQSQRGSVIGRVVLSDPLVNGLINLRVGVAQPPYVTTDGVKVDWQRESKFYQFWTIADTNDSFVIPNVHAGDQYTLYAIADNVLGELRVDSITVRPSSVTDVGILKWTPLRYGPPLWEIGVPDRTAGEFRHGDDYWHWGLYFQYQSDFPTDVDFDVGVDDWSKSWNYCQPPLLDRNCSYGGERCRSTTWTIRFDVSESVATKYALRVGICGVGHDTRGVQVSVNGVSVGVTDAFPMASSVMHRDGIRGYWQESVVMFDGKLLVKGSSNRIQLTPQVTSWTDGVMYDYLRLEAM